MVSLPFTLSFLACPLSHQALEYDPDTQTLICESSGMRYPIEDGIPVLVSERAMPIDHPVS